jgi:hypothetical protein
MPPHGASVGSLGGFGDVGRKQPFDRGYRGKVCEDRVPQHLIVLKALDGQMQWRRDQDVELGWNVVTA